MDLLIVALGVVVCYRGFLVVSRKIQRKRHPQWGLFEDIAHTLFVRNKEGVYSIGHEESVCVVLRQRSISANLFLVSQGILLDHWEKIQPAARTIIFSIFRQILRVNSTALFAERACLILERSGGESQRWEEACTNLYQKLENAVASLDSVLHAILHQETGDEGENNLNELLRSLLEELELTQLVQAELSEIERLRGRTGSKTTRPGTRTSEKD